MEDIDCASADLISQIMNLCDSRETRVASGETIQMHNEAYIVATMRYIFYAKLLANRGGKCSTNISLSARFFFEFLSTFL